MDGGEEMSGFGALAFGLLGAFALKCVAEK